MVVSIGGASGSKCFLYDPLRYECQDDDATCVLTSHLSTDDFSEYHTCRYRIRLCVVFDRSGLLPLLRLLRAQQDPFIDPTWSLIVCVSL